MVSEKAAVANKKNAQLSTGPTTQIHNKEGDNDDKAERKQPVSSHGLILSSLHCLALFEPPL